MLSRVANSIYWMSRHIERAENVARFVDTNLQMILDLPEGTLQQWQPLVNVTGDSQYFNERYGQADERNVIQFLTFDKHYTNSILSCLCYARDNARTVREYITLEMWEQINKFYLMVNSDEALAMAHDSSHEFFSKVMMASHLFEGITNATMSHNEGWHFSQLGRMIERADKTSRILDVKYFILLPAMHYVGMTFDYIQWSALLRSTSGFEMYRKRHGKLIQEKIVEFLLLDQEFPRSVHFCVREAERSLLSITNTPPGTYTNQAERRMGLLRSEFDYANAGDIIESGLHEFIDNFQVKLNGIDDAVFDTFFALRPISSLKPAF